MHDVHETVSHLLRNSCLLELITLREETVSGITKPPQRRHCDVVNLDRLRGTYGTVAGKVDEQCSDSPCTRLECIVGRHKCCYIRDAA